MSSSFNRSLLSYFFILFFFTTDVSSSENNANGGFHGVEIKVLAFQVYAILNIVTTVLTKLKIFFIVFWVDESTLLYLRTRSKKMEATNLEVWRKKFWMTQKTI